MAWSYSNSPATVVADQVRLEIGDTDINAPLLSDEEIQYLILANTDAYLAAAAGCMTLSRRFSRQVDKSVGNASLSASQRANAYRDRAAELRAQAVRVTGLSGIHAGGLSIAEKEAHANNPDAVQPSFSIGQDDLSGTGTTQGLNPLLGSY